MFEFKVTLNDEDWIAFNKYVALNNPLTKKRLNKTKRTGPMLFYSFTIAMFILNHNFSLFLIGIALMTILSILWIIKSEKIYVKAVENNIKNFVKEGEVPYNHEEAIIKFDDEAVSEISESIDSKIKYSIMQKNAITEDAVYVFINTGLVYILPTRIFSDNEQKEKFIEFINSKVDCIHSEKSV